MVCYPLNQASEKTTKPRWFLALTGPPGRGLGNPVLEKHQYVPEIPMTIILKINLVEEEISHAELKKCTGESPGEAGVPTTVVMTKTKTWNIRTLYETGNMVQVCWHSLRHLIDSFM